MQEMSKAALRLTTLLLYGVQLPGVPKEGRRKGNFQSKQ